MSAGEFAGRDRSERRLFERRLALEAIARAPDRSGRAGTELAGSGPDLAALNQPPLLNGDRRGYVLRRFLAVSDVVCLLGALAVANLMNVAAGRGVLDRETMLIFLFLTPCWVGLGGLLGLYHLTDRRLDHSAVDEIGPVALTATVWGWLFLLTRSVVESGQPKELFPSIIIWLATIVFVLMGRSVVRTMARRQPWYRQRAAVLGAPKDVSRVIRRVRRHPEYGLDVECVMEIQDGGLLRMQPGLARSGHRSNDEGANGDGDPQLGALDEVGRMPLHPSQLAEIITVAGISRVILASTPEDLGARSSLIRSIVKAGAHVDVVAGDADAFSSTAVLHYVEGLPVLTTPSVPIPRAWLALKRAFDGVVSASLLLLLSPALAYIALRIKLDSPGPVFFRQPRVGRRGQQFRLLKFRTMVADADAQKADVSALNIHAGSDTPGMFKIPDDPRITRFGAKLRRWSLDELPQLWTVLKGNMSLVGPRPLIEEEAFLVADEYVERFRVRPGVTGPWQTLGRSEIGFEDMIKLDYTYVVHWSFAQDLRILMRTGGAVIEGKGAY